MSDKRTVSTDALETLGTIIGPEQKRDAIHLAVIPAVAGERLARGDHVALVNGAAWIRLQPDAGPHDSLGIVDPFLKTYVDKGEWFWLVIYPRVITSLRHVWTHPDLSDEAGVSNSARDESKAWLEAYASRLFGGDAPYYGETDRTSLEVLIACAEGGSFGTDIEGPERSPTSEFWMHFERFVGRPAKEKPDWFHCAC